MRIIDKLKALFFGTRKKEQQLFLPDNDEFANEDIRTRYAVRPVKNPREPALEECIEEFIKQYRLQEDISPENPNKSYNAFRRMFCDQPEPMGNNYKNQQSLMKFVKKHGGRTSTQYSNDRAVFMHISGEIGIDEKKNHEVEKLYINCERKDISLLAGVIYREIRNVAGEKLQMKCISEQYFRDDEQREGEKTIKNYQRNDKIVIYAVDHKMAEIITEKINALRLKKTKLFATVKAVPLLPKKCGFIGVGKENRGASAKTPLGYASGRTYNEFLSDIMFQSIVAGFDENISGTSSGHDSNPEERMSQYVSIYNNMIPDQRNAIISKSRGIFLQICRENNVNTIYTPTITGRNQTVQKSL